MGGTGCTGFSLNSEKILETIGGNKIRRQTSICIAKSIGKTGLPPNIKELMQTQSYFFKKCVMPLLLGEKNIDNYKILESNQGFFLIILAKEYLLMINASAENVPLMKSLFEGIS